MSKRIDAIKAWIARYEENGDHEKAKIERRKLAGIRAWIKIYEKRGKQNKADALRKEFGIKVLR